MTQTFIKRREFSFTKRKQYILISNSCTRRDQITTEYFVFSIYGQQDSIKTALTTLNRMRAVNPNLKKLFASNISALH